MIDGVKPVYGTSVNVRTKSNQENALCKSFQGGTGGQQERKKQEQKESPAFEVILSRKMNEKEEGNSVKVLKR